MMKNQATIRSPGLGSFNWKTHFKGKARGVKPLDIAPCRMLIDLIRMF